MLFAHFNILVVNYDKYMQSIKMHNYYTKYKMDIAIKSMQHKIIVNINQSQWRTITKIH